MSTIPCESMKKRTNQVEQKTAFQILKGQIKPTFDCSVINRAGYVVILHSVMFHLHHHLLRSHVFLIDLSIVSMFGLVV